MSKTFAPTPNELALVNQIFTRVDTQKTGILTGDVAVEVFQGSRLPPQTLGEIWQLADSDNQGFLTRKGVAIALRLIGHAQKGEQVGESSISKRM
jgi:epidermal growth factor receptor substrate 15